MKNRTIILILFLILTAFPARADWGPGPPEEVVFLVGALGVIGGFFGCWMIAWILHNVLELFTKKKRKHRWFSASGMFIFLAVFLYLDDQNFLYFVEYDYGYETRVKVYQTGLWLSPLLGFIPGYLLTPKKKSDAEIPR